MSFGFGVGDFIAVIKLANQIRNDFASAPKQFAEASDLYAALVEIKAKLTSNRIKSFSIALDAAGGISLGRKLDEQEKAKLEHITGGCRKILTELQHVLDTNAKLKPQQKSFSLTKFWKQLNWRPDDIRDLRDNINVHITLLKCFTDTVRGEDQHRRDVLNWLTPIDSASEQYDVFKRRQEGTGRWLLKSDEFEVWVRTRKQTLSCWGIPGAGKTILTSIVVDELHTRFQNDSSIIVAYLYCNFKKQDEQEADGLLANLLKQLAEGKPLLPKSVQSLYDKCKEKKTRPSINGISETLRLVVAEYSQVFILVDALDECRALGGGREKLLSTIFDLQTHGVNFFATSRDEPEIKKKFKQSPSLEIRADEQDLRKYIESRISDLPSFVRRDHDLQEEVKTKIVEAVTGVFLLAKLHINSLIDKTALEPFRAALQNLPNGDENGDDAYNRAYDDTMDRIEKQSAGQVKLAKQVLSWLTCAKRALTMIELQHALAVRVDEPKFNKGNIIEIEDMIPLCAGLVMVEEQSNTIGLVHYTTQKYLEATLSRWCPTAEFDITATCITYLSFTVFESGFCHTDFGFEYRLELNPLYNYAACYWGHHARQASSLNKRIIAFLECTSKVEAAFQAMRARKRYSGHYYYSQKVPRQMTGLHLAAYLGLTEPVEVMLRSFDIDSKDTYRRTPLLLAAMKGHEAVVKLLLDIGKADTELYDSRGRTPLSWAAARGHTAIVKLLLDSGKVDLCSKNINEIYTTASIGNNRFKIRRFVRCPTPLWSASSNGREAIVKLLLDTGKVDPDWGVDPYWHEAVWEEDHRTPLSQAAENGYEGIVKLLVETGKINVDAKNNNGQTPLFLAAQNGREAVVKLLLEMGKADAESKDKNGQTPLWRAIKNGHDIVVKLLLETGKVDVEFKDEHDMTPLSWATKNGYEAVTKMLLETDKVKVDSRNNDGRTPLS